MTAQNLTDDIERLRALHSLIVELTPAPAPAPDPIAQLRDVLALAKDLAPAPAPAVDVTEGSAPLPADAPPMALVIDRVAGVLEKMLDRQAAASVAAGNGAPPLSTEEPTTVKVPSWLAPFLGYLPQLIEMADAGQAPELVAQQIAARLTPAHIEALEPVLTHDGFPSSIVGMIPHLEQRSQWALPFLYALRAAVLPTAVVVTDDESDAE